MKHQLFSLVSLVVRRGTLLALTALLGACPWLATSVDAGARSPVVTFERERAATAGPAIDALRPPTLAANEEWVALPPLVLDEDGRTGPITIAAADDVVAFQIVALSEDDAQVLIPVSLTAPSGARWIEDEVENPAPGYRIASGGFPAQLLSRQRVLFNTRFGSWTFPGTPDLPFESGRWIFEVGVYAPDLDDEERRVAAHGTVGLAVILYHAGEIKVTDLIVHLAHEEIDAATAADHPVLGPAVDILVSVLREAGITLGETRFENVADPSLRTITLLDNICQGGDLDTLLSSSQGRGLHLFLVERFFCVIGDGALEIGEQIGGLAGGLPGPGPIAGTSQSGVAVAVEFAADDPEKLGAIMAHEIGHSLGLFHTKEASRFDAPDLFDIILDTPEGAPGVSENLMYFVAQTDLRLSAGQQEVLLRNLGRRP